MLYEVITQKAMERDNFMTAEDAKKFGLIDKVVEKSSIASDDAEKTDKKKK